MRKHTMLLAAAVALTGACSKTANGDLVVKRPADVNVTTTQDTLHLPKMGSKLDTINSPVVGSQKETLIVNKPVVGTEKRIVRVPVIRKP